MRKIEFTQEEIKQLSYQSIHHTHHIVRRRMQALLLKSQGLSHREIGEILNISQTTLREYFDLYTEDGLDALKQLNYQGQTSLLEKKKDEIIAVLEADPPATLKQAQAKMKEATGLERSLPQVSEFLQENKLIRRKVKQIPAKADVAAQEKFKTETLEPLIEEAQQGNLHLFFVDAAHFVFLPFLGYLYSLAVRSIKVASGRKRFNVLGALNVVTQELVTFTNFDYINAEAVCSLLETLRQKFSLGRLVLVMDNARYQRCQKVFDKAKSLNIELLFLPPYSPNLNLIERLWKFVRQEVLYNESFKNFDEFCQAISGCLNETDTTHKEALDTLLTPKFQTFENATFLP
jgi:transposase